MGIQKKQDMGNEFFSGSYNAKLDDKSRFVLPQNLRYKLVENGELNFSIGLSMGGCLAIYKKSEIEALVQKFKEKKHIAKFQKFFTLFFSTLVQTTCDKVGRVTLSSVLQKTIGIEKELIISGSMDKIEIWPKKKYEELFSVETIDTESFDELMEEAFSSKEEEKRPNLEMMLENAQTKVKV